MLQSRNNIYKYLPVTFCWSKKNPLNLGERGNQVYILYIILVQSLNALISI